MEVWLDMRDLSIDMTCPVGHDSAIKNEGLHQWAQSVNRQGGISAAYREYCTNITHLLFNTNAKDEIPQWLQNFLHRQFKDEDITPVFITTSSGQGCSSLIIPTGGFEAREDCEIMGLSCDASSEQGQSKLMAAIGSTDWCHIDLGKEVIMGEVKDEGKGRKRVREGEAKTGKNWLMIPAENIISHADGGTTSTTTT